MDSPEQSRLNHILAAMVEEHGWHKAQWLQRMALIWQRVVGDAISRNTRILTLTSDGILVVAVPSSVWAQELLYLKPRILDAIHDALPAIPIHDIRTRIRADVHRQPVEGESSRHSPYFRTHLALNPREDLGVLLARVQEKYQIAAHEWLKGGFYPCIQCHAPTLKGYSLCVVCDLKRQQNSR